MKRSEDQRHLEVRASGAGISTAIGKQSGSFWLPRACNTSITAAIWEDLRYVVVDELDADRVLLLSYMWPRLTEAGGLHFGEDPRHRGVTVYPRKQKLLDWEPPHREDWRDAPPGMPIVFYEICFPDAGDNELMFLADPVGPGGGEYWSSARMPRLEVQGAIDSARAQGWWPPEEARRTGDTSTSSRPLRVGDTFALVSRLAPSSSRVVATQIDEPLELVALRHWMLFDITNQARVAARAAQAAAVSPPKSRQVFGTESDVLDTRARKWESPDGQEVEPVFRDRDETDEVGAGPQDAQPTV